MFFPSKWDIHIFKRNKNIEDHTHVYDELKIPQINQLVYGIHISCLKISNTHILKNILEIKNQNCVFI